MSLTTSFMRQSDESVRERLQNVETKTEAY